MWIPMTWFFFRALTRDTFPKTRRAVRKAQARVKRSKAIGRVS